MGIGLWISVGLGWLVGAIGNWLADQLPHLPQQPLRFERTHVLRSLIPTWQITYHGATPAANIRPWRNLLLLTGMAIAFAVNWLLFGTDMGQLLVACFYTAWLLLVVVIDFEHRRVLNIMLPPAIVATLIAPLLTLLGWAHLLTYSSTLLGGLAGFGLFVVIFVVGRGRMMGAGDVKLSGVVGLMMGYPLVWFALMAGIFLGGIAAIALLIRRRTAKSYMAYGPYLALGALLMMWLYWP